MTSSKMIVKTEQSGDPDDVQYDTASPSPTKDTKDVKVSFLDTVVVRYKANPDFANNRDGSLKVTE